MVLKREGVVPGDAGEGGEAVEEGVRVELPLLGHGVARVGHKDVGEAPAQPRVHHSPLSRFFLGPIPPKQGLVEGELDFDIDAEAELVLRLVEGMEEELDLVQVLSQADGV